MSYIDGKFVHHNGGLVKYIYVSNCIINFSLPCNFYNHWLNIMSFINTRKQFILQKYFRGPRTFFYNN